MVPARGRAGGSNATDGCWRASAVVDRDDDSGNGVCSIAKQLIKGYNEQILGMTDTDQFLFDDGCVGGTSSHDPLYIVVPLTDPPSAQGACSATTGAPIIVSPAGITCWQTTLEAARTECEDAWNDPEHALRSASVTVDGRAQRLELTRVDGTFTFPEGAILDAPGLNTVYYGITEAVKIHGLNP